MSKESDRKEINRILHRMVASPFRAILGDGGGTVDVAGKTGYVWARKLGREEIVFQAYNRGVSEANEGRVVLAQESRVEGLPGYEVIGSAGGDYIDLSGHIATEPFDAHLNNPACRVYHDADKVIANNTLTALEFNSERFDTDTMHDTVVNNSRITIKTAGIYLLSAMAIFASDAVGHRLIAFRVNGATYISQYLTDAALSGAIELETTCIYQFVANDYVEVMVRQTSGDNLNILTGAQYSPEFMAARVG